MRSKKKCENVVIDVKKGNISLSVLDGILGEKGKP
jgi:hypothetical protein